MGLVPTPSQGRSHYPGIHRSTYTSGYDSEIFLDKGSMHHLQSLPIRTTLEFEWQMSLEIQILLTSASSFSSSSSFHHPSPSFSFSSSLLPPATPVVLLGFHVVFLLSGWLSLDWCQIQGTNTVRRGRPPPVSLRDSLRLLTY